MDRKPPFLRTAHNYDTNAASDETGLACPPEDKLTQDNFAEECDINTIVRRFGLTGQMPDNPRMPSFGDFTGINDFQTAMNAIVSAKENFMELPANVRARFNHDPQQLLEFVTDDANRPEAEKLGLVKPKEPPVAPQAPPEAPK